MKKLLCITLVLCTGCASMNASTGDHFAMNGTPEGIRAFGDTLVGALKTAKEKDNAKNQYFEHRANYEQNVTTRAKEPSLFQKMFSTEQKGS